MKELLLVFFISTVYTNPIPLSPYDSAYDAIGLTVVGGRVQKPDACKVYPNVVRQNLDCEVQITGIVAQKQPLGYDKVEELLCLCQADIQILSDDEKTVIGKAKEENWAKITLVEAGGEKTVNVAVAQGLTEVTTSDSRFNQNAKDVATDFQKNAPIDALELATLMTLGADGKKLTDAVYEARKKTEFSEIDVNTENGIGAEDDSKDGPTTDGKDISTTETDKPVPDNSKTVQDNDDPK